MSAINCTPNLPPSGWSVLGWRPGPPAMRTCPRTQYPTSTCTKAPPPDLPCPRPCEARYLKSPARPRTIRYVPDQPWPISQPPCNPPPPVPPYTCRAIGSRRLTEHIQFKYSYPGLFTAYFLIQARREGGVWMKATPASRRSGATPSARNIKYARMYYFEKNEKFFPQRGPVKMFGGRENVSPGPAEALDGPVLISWPTVRSSLGYDMSSVFR